MVPTRGRGGGGSRWPRSAFEPGPGRGSPPTEMSRQAAPAFPAGTSKCAPSQRVPALTGTTASKNDRAGLFECPVCCGYALPPILHCQSGHLVCSNCCPKAHVVQPAGAVGIPSQLGPGGSGQFPCFPPPVNMPLLEERYLCHTHRKQTMKSSVSLGLIRVRALVLPANGKALWMLSSPYMMHWQSPLQPYRERI